VAGLNNSQLRNVFNEWNQGDDLKSFLIEITAKVIDFADPDGSGKPLVEVILDKAGAKGTGKWTTQTALDLGVAIPTITAAVDARSISALKEQRVKAAGLLSGPSSHPIGNVLNFIHDVRDALYCSKICSYAQGMAMLNVADKAFGYGMKLDEIARIWKAGCIIRAVFLNSIMQAFKEQPQLENLLLDKRFRDAINTKQDAWRRVIAVAINNDIPTPAFSASLAYYDSYRRERLPANLIQAQRDYFGAHTYERLDKPGIFHTEWSAQTPAAKSPEDHKHDEARPSVIKK